MEQRLTRVRVALAVFAKMVRNKTHLSEENQNRVPEMEPDFPYLPPTPRPTEKVEIGYFRNNFSYRDIEFDKKNGFQGGPVSKRKAYQVTLWSFVALAIDALLLLASSCLFLICFSYVVKAGMSSLLRDLFVSQSLGILFIQAYVVSAWAYMITLRLFMGSTVGEWACDLRLGQPHQRLQSGYVLRVMLRTSLILLTGLLPLPLLSLVFGVDVPGKISGVSLYSLK